jgi:hypothetical protein
VNYYGVSEQIARLSTKLSVRNNTQQRHTSNQPNAVDNKKLSGMDILTIRHHREIGLME